MLYKNQISFRDNIYNERVFNNAELTAKFQEPENLNSVEMYIDNTLIDKKTDVKDKAVITFNINTKNLKDGIKKVKIIAKDNNENEYYDYTKIKIVNKAKNSVRARITDNGYPLRYKTVFLYGKDKNKKDAKFDIKFSYLTDEEGYVDVPENVIKNISKNYVLCSSDYLNYFSSSFYDIFNEDSFGFVKEMNSYGVVSIDVKDFIHVNRNSLEGESQSKTFGFFKLKNGEIFKEFPLVLDNNTIEYSPNDEIAEPELLVPKGVYSTVLLAETKEDNENKYYMLNNKNVNLKKDGVTVDFSKKNLSQINFNYTDSDTINDNFKIFHLEYLNEKVIISLAGEKDPNKAIINVSPGEYTPYCNLFEFNEDFSSSTYSGEVMNIKNNLNEINFGGELKGKVDIDKKTYKKSSVITLKPDITDFYSNKLVSAVSIKFDNLSNIELKNNLINQTKNLNSIDKIKSLILDAEELKDSNSLLNFKIYDSKGNSVYEKNDYYLAENSYRIPFDIKCGKYKGEITTTYPIKSSSEVFFRVK